MVYTVNCNTHLFKVVVVSDTILAGGGVDISGEKAVEILREKGFCVSGKEVVGNSYRDILRVLRSSQERVIVFLGGTGPSPRDLTVDVVESTAWRCLPGFGELFRYLTYQKIGVRAVLTRTTLCIMHDGKIVVVLPGSPDATSLGLDILIQVIDHIIEEVDRFEGPIENSSKCVIGFDVWGTLFDLNKIFDAISIEASKRLRVETRKVQEGILKAYEDAKKLRRLNPNITPQELLVKSRVLMARALGVEVEVVDDVLNLLLEV